MNVVLEGFLLIFRITYYWFEAIYRKFFPPAAKKIAGEVAFVTGGGRGIGREIALELAALGARVAVCDINETECADTARIITESGGTARAYRCDVTNIEDVAETASKVRRELGDVDILVNNAGVLVVKNILKLSDQEILRTMNVNAVSQFWTVRQFLPAMISKNHGHIAIIVSLAGITTGPLLTDYCSSKFAAHAFAEALSADLRDMKVSGIDVTTVYPHFVNSNMVLGLRDRIATHDRFSSGNLSPKQVAVATVDGILHRRRYVFVPRFMAVTPFVEQLPEKVTLAIKDFFQTRFVEISRG